MLSPPEEKSWGAGSVAAQQVRITSYNVCYTKLLRSLMSLQVGESLNVGRIRLRVAQVLTYEPDRGLNFFSVAPRLLMNLADVEATGLIVPGSRVSYRLLLAGEYKIIRNNFV